MQVWSVKSRHAARVKIYALCTVTPAGCWEWTKYRHPKGYGMAYMDGLRHPAHRLAWLGFRGRFARGLLVCHKCDNPPCCNPAHLFLGTVSDNARDSVAKGRWNGRFNAIGKVSGENNGKCKFKDREVRAMRRLWNGGSTLDEIALATGAHRNWIHKIVTGMARRKPARTRRGRRGG